MTALPCRGTRTLRKLDVDRAHMHFVYKPQEMMVCVVPKHNMWLYSHILAWIHLCIYMKYLCTYTFQPFPRTSFKVPIFPLPFLVFILTWTVCAHRPEVWGSVGEGYRCKGHRHLECVSNWNIVFAQNVYCHRVFGEPTVRNKKKKKTLLLLYILIWYLKYMLIQINTVRI